MPKITTLLSASLLLLSFSSANAATTLYTSEAAFLNDLDPSRTVTQNFEGFTPGGIIPSGSIHAGATFVYDIPGVSIMVDNYFDTTSPGNYLGTDDGSGAFLGGDEFTLNFDQTIHAVGMYLISADYIYPGDFTITTNMGQSVSNIDIPSLSLTDGEAYYLGLIENDLSLGFNSITLSSYPENYLFNVDDITVSAVPEPSTLLLFGLGLLSVVGMSRRKANQNITMQSV